MVTYTKKAVRGTVIVMLNTALASFFSYLLRLLLSRTLDINDFGLFYAVFTFLTFLLFFRGTGLKSATVKYISEFNAKKNYNKVKTILFSSLVFQLLFSLIFMIALFVLSDFLAIAYFKNPLVSAILKFFTLYVFCSTILQFFLSIFRGFQKVVLFSSVNTLNSFLVLVFTFIFVKFELNIFSPVFGYIAATIFGSIIFLPFAWKVFSFSKYKISGFSRTTKQLMFFGLPAVLTGISGRVISYIDTLMLTYFRPLSEVAVYNVVLPSAMTLLSLSGGFLKVLFPIVSELWAKKKYGSISEGLRMLYKYSFLILVPFIFIIFVYSELFINMLFGKQFVSGVLSFRILAIGVVLFLIANINNSIISAIGKPKIVTKIIIIASIINVLLNLVLIPILGMFGAAITTSLSYLFVLIVSIIVIKRYISISVPWKKWLLTLVIGLVFIGIIYVLKELFVMNVWLELILITVISFAIYTLLAYLLNLFDINEIKKYVRLVK